MSIVKVKRLERNISWGARDPKTGGIAPKYSNCFDKWVPGLDKSTGMLRTGLKNEDEEKSFEKKIGLEPGDLSRGGKYWENFSIVIPEEGITIDTQDPIGELKYKALLSDPKVAKSIEEANLNANAEFVMTSDSAEAKSKNNKRDSIANAYAKFAGMSKNEVYDALLMFGKEADATDPEVCRNILGETLERNPARFLDVVGDPKFKDKTWMIRLIKTGIVRKNGVGSGYDVPLYFGDIVLGNGLEDAIAYIKDKENQNIYIGLKKAHDAYLKEKA